MGEYITLPKAREIVEKTCCDYDVSHETKEILQKFVERLASKYGFYFPKSELLEAIGTLHNKLKKED